MPSNPTPGKQPKRHAHEYIPRMYTDVPGIVLYLRCKHIVKVSEVNVVRGRRTFSPPAWEVVILTWCHPRCINLFYVRDYGEAKQG